MNIAFLLAAGHGRRFKGDKLFVLLKGKPVIYHSLRFLEESPCVDTIFIAANSKNKKAVEKLVKQEKFKKVKKIIMGGASRYESVIKLTQTINSHRKADFFIIHNVVNPLATHRELNRCLESLAKNPSLRGVAVGRPVISTIKKIHPLQIVARIAVPVRQYSLPSIISTIPRHNLWEVETPQVVRTKDFVDACDKTHVMVRESHHDTAFTDDLSVLEAAGFKTAIVQASPYNRKITNHADLAMLKFFAGDVPKDYAVGTGEDSHKFAKRKKNTCLLLGGVKIKNMPPLEAESDGDVIIHALCNAIASAIGERSLGTYANKMCKRGILDSRKYLEKILQKMRRKKFRLVNCAISIEAANPKIDPIVQRIKGNLSVLLNLTKEHIGINATSGEKLTPFGRGKGIKCQAVILLGEC